MKINISKNFSFMKEKNSKKNHLAQTFFSTFMCAIMLSFSNLNAQCTPTTATSPFFNGDFNIFTPPTASEQLANANGWVNLSGASPDLFASGAYLGGSGIPINTIPSPNGGAWAGILTRTSPDTWVEYIGKALDTPLTTGTYDLILDLGAGSGSGSNQTLDIVIYSIPLASSLPFSGRGFITSAGIGAVEVGRLRVTLLQNTWQTNVVIPLTVPAGSTFEFLAIGTDNLDPATATTGLGSVLEYTLIDNIRLTLNLTTNPVCNCPSGVNGPRFF